MALRGHRKTKKAPSKPLFEIKENGEIVALPSEEFGRLQKLNCSSSKKGNRQFSQSHDREQQSLTTSRFGKSLRKQLFTQKSEKKIPVIKINNVDNDACDVSIHTHIKTDIANINKLNVEQCQDLEKDRDFLNFERICNGNLNNKTFSPVNALLENNTLSPDKNNECQITSLIKQYLKLDEENFNNYIRIREENMNKVYNLLEMLNKDKNPNVSGKNNLIYNLLLTKTNNLRKTPNLSNVSNNLKMEQTPRVTKAMNMYNNLSTNQSFNISVSEKLQKQCISLLYDTPRI